MPNEKQVFPHKTFFFSKYNGANVINSLTWRSIQAVMMQTEINHEGPF